MRSERTPSQTVVSEPKRDTLGVSNVSLFARLGRGPVVLLGALMLQTSVFADVIENKTGQRLEGLITKETDQQVSIEVDGMELTLARSDVKSVVRGPVQKKKRPVIVLPAETKTAPPAAPVPPPAAQGQDLSGLEKPIIVFDDRKWILANQDMRNNIVTAQFVLDGESASKWTEMVWAQLYVGLRTEPKFYVQYVREEAAKQCPGGRWETIKETPYDVTYFRSINGCANVPDQSEIARIILGVDGLHILHYAMKMGDMPVENQQKWIQCLEASQLVKPQPQNNNASGNKP